MASVKDLTKCVYFVVRVGLEKCQVEQHKVQHVYKLLIGKKKGTLADTDHILSYNKTHILLHFLQVLHTKNNKLYTQESRARRGEPI